MAQSSIVAPFPVIGLAGGIGSGKSVASERLAELGAHIIDMDRVGHRILARGGAAHDTVVQTFGPAVVDDTGEVDRRKLGALVFAEPERLKTLNGIMHPIMAREVAREVGVLAVRPKADRPAAVIVDAAILLESGWDVYCDEVWVVEAEPEVAIERLMQRDGFDREAAESRLRAQLTNEQRRGRAHVVLTNNSTPEELIAQVDHAWQERVMTRASTG